jgi:hypothetical protein
LNPWQKRTLRLVRDCRTAAMGGHIDQCPGCEYLRISYNSCRNRHCPKCQVLSKDRWIQARERELLPVPYFHVVFTLPEQVNRLCLFAPDKVYDALFATAWGVIRDFAGDHKHLGAQTGMIGVLHTWGQNLSLHPHLHCIVPGGGLTGAGKWKTARANGKFLFPANAMAAVFRARMAAGLRKGFPGEPKAFFESLFKTQWVVYAKQPFANPLAVIRYLGRYTHKIAISNHRLLSIDQDRVCFTWKDYRHGGARKQMALPAMEFIRRFAQHILPRSFVRMRHYGILSSRKKAISLPQIHLQLTGKVITWEKPSTGPAPLPICPVCGKHRLQTILRFDHRGPPADFELHKSKQKAA